MIYEMLMRIDGIVRIYYKDDQILMNNLRKTLAYWLRSSLFHPLTDLVAGYYDKFECAGYYLWRGCFYYSLNQSFLQPYSNIGLDNSSIYIVCLSITFLLAFQLSPI